MFKKLNAYLLARPKLLLALIWVFFALAFIPAVYITLTDPGMPYLKFLGCCIVQVAIALYLRILYSNHQREKKAAIRAEREAKRAAAQKSRHGKKKK